MKTISNINILNCRNLRKMPLTLYAVSDGPPSLAVRQALKALNIDYNHINVDFGLGEHMTDDFEKV